MSALASRMKQLEALLQQAEEALAASRRERDEELAAIAQALGAAGKPELKTLCALVRELREFAAAVRTQSTMDDFGSQSTRLDVEVQCTPDQLSGPAQTTRRDAATQCTADELGDAFPVARPDAAELKRSRQVSNGSNDCEDDQGCEWQRLLRAINVPIISVDSHGTITGWNKKAEWLTGYLRDEAVGKDFMQHFVHNEFADSVDSQLQEAFRGQDTSSHEMTISTKDGHRRDIFLSMMAQCDHQGANHNVHCFAQDITSLRSDSQMQANYMKICNAAVWFLSGCASTGRVLQVKTRDIEHLVSQQAKMETSDPRMVLWRASFVSILRVMCRELWSGNRGPGPTPPTSFEYEFCFEAASGQVKWYKVQGHLTEMVNRQNHDEFEVIGCLQEVTSMFIQKVIGDAWQKWWSRMCLMVFDATLLVDTQEYRVLNAWGEEKVFGCKVPSNHPIVPLIKAEDFESLKRAFSEATHKGSERGRTLHLLRQRADGKAQAWGRDGSSLKEMPAQCFLLAGDQENPNECMMGIRMQVASDVQLWDVAKTNSVLTLDDLARLSSGLKRGKMGPSRTRIVRKCLAQQGRRGHDLPGRGGLHTNPSQSLMSIPEDLTGESENSDPQSDSAVESSSVSGASSKSSNHSAGSPEQDIESDDASDVGVCNSIHSHNASLSESALRPSFGRGRTCRVSPKHRAGSPGSPGASGSSFLPLGTMGAKPIAQPVIPPRTGPLDIILRWANRTFSINLAEFESVDTFREHVESLTGVPAGRQTLILAGRRLPVSQEDPSAPSWAELTARTRPGQALMMLGSPASQDAVPPAGPPAQAEPELPEPSQ